MPTSDLSSLLVLVEPSGTVARAVFEFPENANHRRFGRTGAALTDGDHRSYEIGLSTQILDAGSSMMPYLALSFDPGPKDLSKGFVFGSDPTTCDILLAKDKNSGVSGNHFSINVDWCSGNPLITCLTANTGMHIFSGPDDIWTLYLQAECEELTPDTTRTIKIFEKLKLIVRTPGRISREPDYSSNLHRYFKRCQDAVPDMTHLQLSNPDPTPLMVNRSRGLTGREYCTTSTFTGDFVVHCNATRPYMTTGESETFVVKRFRKTSAGWQNHARKNLSWLRGLRHRHIIVPEDIITVESESMPVYLREPRETLADRQRNGLFTEAEAGKVLAQVFEGLQFLHSHTVVHGNIWPGSIRMPSYSLWPVKLSDISLHPYVELEDRKKRELYASQRAPGKSKPTYLSDTWSAGVVGLVLLCERGLPSRPKTWRLSQQTWAEMLVDQAKSFLALDEILSRSKKEAALFLLRVLKVDFAERLTAEECLEDPWLHAWRLPPSYYEQEDSEDEDDGHESGGEGSSKPIKTEEPSSSKSKGKQPQSFRPVSHHHRWLSAAPKKPTSS